jgi:hypothetical protein
MEKWSMNYVVAQLHQIAKDITRYDGSRSDLMKFNSELANLKATANKYLPLSITVDEILSHLQESQQTRRLTTYWDFVYRDEKTKSESGTQHLRNITIRCILKTAGFYTALLIGISFTVEALKHFNDEDLREICTTAEHYIEAYDLKSYFLQMGFYRVTGKLVGSVPEWEAGMFSTLSKQGWNLTGRRRNAVYK